MASSNVTVSAPTAMDTTLVISTGPSPQSFAGMPQTTGLGVPQQIAQVNTSGTGMVVHSSQLSLTPSPQYSQITSQQPSYLPTTAPSPAAVSPQNKISTGATPRMITETKPPVTPATYQSFSPNSVPLPSNSTSNSEQVNSGNNNAPALNNYPQLCSPGSDTGSSFSRSCPDDSDSERPYKMARLAKSRDGRELLQCPTPGCDGMGHVSGNYATHRR